MEKINKSLLLEIYEGHESIPIDEKQFIKWIQALRSGEYKQTRSTLQDKHGFCCLGVGCKVLIPKKMRATSPEGVMTGLLPDSQIAAPQWLKTIDEDFAKKTKKSLSDLNDNGLGVDKEGLTFDEIADLLEAVYVHGVLEKK